MIQEKVLSDVIEIRRQYKETQRQSWDSVAVGWQEWWQTFEKDAQRLSDHLLELPKINFQFQSSRCCNRHWRTGYYRSKES